MYGIFVEYGATVDGAPEPPGRFACRMAMTRQIGYRRRLALTTACRQRAADLFLFVSPELARAALDSATLCASLDACATVLDREPALLLNERPWGEVCLLRRAAAPDGHERAYRDERFAASEPRAMPW